MKPLLEGRGLSKEYTVDHRRMTVLDNISLTAEAGDFLVIRGNSGSGKTTLLSLLSGLDQPTSGTVSVDGQEITALTEDELAPFRNRIFGFVFQSFHLVPSLTALENVMLPAQLNRNPDAEIKARDLMETVSLTSRLTSFPHQLSGGEKQRVAICRALINDPRILFADEPTGNLDSENSGTILNLLIRLQKKRGAALILVTHSSEIAEMAGRTIFLRDGRIV